METIKNYLETMFAQMPQTPQILEIKEDLFLNMEEKYHELKNEGKSENEAIGIVISEFGNINELINELGISIDSDTQTRDINIPLVTLDTALSYLDVKKGCGSLIGFGVVLILIGVSFLIGLNSLANLSLRGALTEDSASLLGVIGLILFIVPAVGLFIYSGTKLEKYNELQEPFQLDFTVKEQLKSKYEDFLPRHNRSVIIGVCLCILSVIPVVTSSLLEDIYTNNSFILEGSSFGVIILLLTIATAVYLFISSGSIKEGYSCLLKIDDFNPAKRNSKENKLISAVAAIVWPLAACSFLLIGFIWNRWSIAWIVFPITGILFGMFSAVCTIILGENRH